MKKVILFFLTSFLCISFSSFSQQNQNFSLNKSVYFYPQSSKLNTNDKQFLDKMAVFLKENNEKLLKIKGHTDNSFQEEDKNLRLSEKRAEMVKKYLMKKGIPSFRLVIQAYGTSQPLLSNKTEYGRTKNRRVDFQVLSN